MGTIINIVDRDGNPYPTDRIKLVGQGTDRIMIQIDDRIPEFETGELITILNLIQNEVEYGVPMSRTVELIELHKKIKKITERKCYK